MTPEARRRQLILEGLELAEEVPLEQVSIEAVAESAGVSRALLFHYFDTRQDFHVAMAEEQARLMLECTEPDLTLEDPIDILRGTIVAFVDFVTENSAVYLALMRGASSADPAMQAVFDHTRSVMVRRTLDHVSLVDLTPTPLIELAVHGWLAFAEDVTIRWLTRPTIDRDDLLQMITSSLPMLALAAGESIPGMERATG